MPVDDGNSPGSNPAVNRLERMIRRWKKADGDQQQNIGQRIIDFLDNHPKLDDYAESIGFSRVGMRTPGERANRDDDGQGGGGGQGGGRDRDGNRSRGGGGGGRPKAPESGGDLLPGTRGKHYQLIRRGGRQYVVYSVKLPGTDRKVNVGWRVTKPGTHGFDENDGRAVTRDQFKNIQLFGTADEIVRRRNGNKHPFKKWLEDVEATYGGSSILKHRETFGILVQGLLENEDAAITTAKLRQTKWYQSRTAAERDWAEGITAAEREQRLRHTEQQVVEHLANIYGPSKNWRNFVDKDKVADWAKKIASGQWDSPAAAMQWWQTREEKKARQIKGTAAWAAWNEQQRELRLVANRPEETFENIRQQAIDFLGYHLKPSAGRQDKPERGTLWHWAQRLSDGQASQHDFMDWLRKRKETYHGYLDPDETWMEGASGYKTIAEQVLGRPLSFNDRLFADFTKRDELGVPVNDGKTRMTAWDFENLVKNDRRFEFSKTAVGEASGLATEIGRIMSGAR